MMNRVLETRVPTGEATIAGFQPRVHTVYGNITLY